MTVDGIYNGLTAVAFLHGTLWGSFMNVCIARMPEDRSVVWPGSACPRCGAGIRPYDNVPVLAWLWLRGRCRACKGAISPMYPLVEAAFGVLAALCFRRVIPDLADLDLPHLLAYCWYGWLCFALMALTFIDTKHSIIPDPFSIYSVPVGVGGAAVLGAVGYVGAPTWQQSAVGALAGGGALAALLGLYWLVRREEGMGMGDVKLLALFGSYFGAFPALFVIVLLGAMLGSVVGIVVAVAKGSGLRLAIPFGPFLALAALAWFFFDEAILRSWSFVLA